MKKLKNVSNVLLLGLIAGTYVVPLSTSATSLSDVLEQDTAKSASIESNTEDTSIANEKKDSKDAKKITDMSNRELKKFGLEKKSELKDDETLIAEIKTDNFEIEEFLKLFTIYINYNMIDGDKSEYDAFISAILNEGFKEDYDMTNEVMYKTLTPSLNGSQLYEIKEKLAFKYQDTYFVLNPIKLVAYGNSGAKVYEKTDTIYASSGSKQTKGVTYFGGFSDYSVQYGTHYIGEQWKGAWGADERAYCIEKNAIQYTGWNLSSSSSRWNSFSKAQKGLIGAMAMQDKSKPTYYDGSGPVPSNSKKAIATQSLIWAVEDGATTLASAKSTAKSQTHGQLNSYIDSVAGSTQDYLNKHAGGDPGTYKGGIQNYGDGNGGDQDIIGISGGPTYDPKGGFKITKGWKFPSLNSNIDWKDLINSTKIKSSDFQIKVTNNPGNSYTYNKTFTLDKNWTVLTSKDEMQPGSYHFQEINNSSGSKINIGSGNFTVKPDQITQLTAHQVENTFKLGNVKVIKDIDMGAITQWGAGTSYTDKDGNKVTIKPEDTQKFVKNQLLPNGKVTVKLTSNASKNGFSYSETKNLAWNGNSYEATFTGLPLGEYTATETVYPTNMKPITTTSTVTVTTDGATKNVHLKNRFEWAKIKVTKKNAETMGIIGSHPATFALWDYDESTGKITNNTPIDVITTNGFGTATSRAIPLNANGTRTIYVQEVATPDGYFMNGVETPIEAKGGYIVKLTTANDTQTIEIDYLDVEKKSGKVIVDKSIQDTDGNTYDKDEQDLSGFEFSIFDDTPDSANYGNLTIGQITNKPQKGKTNPDGHLESDILNANGTINEVGKNPKEVWMTYRLSETGINEDFDWMYSKPADEVFTFANPDQAFYYSYVNILKDELIKIKKLDENKLPIEGVTFDVYNDATQDSKSGEWSYDRDDLVFSGTTDTNGELIVDKLPVNETYYVVERETKVAPDGQEMYYYFKKPTVIDSQYLIDNADTSKDVIEIPLTIENNNVLGNILLEKYDDLGTSFLNGAEFDLDYNYNGDDIKESYVVDEKLSIQDLYVYNPDGSKVAYTLTETKSPAGYYASAPIEFHFEKDDDNIDVVIDSDNPNVIVDNDSLDTDKVSNISIMKVKDARMVVNTSLLKMSTSDTQTADAIEPTESINAADALTTVDKDDSFIDTPTNLDDYTPDNAYRLPGAEFKINAVALADVIDNNGYQLKDNKFSAQDTNGDGKIDESEEWHYKESKSGNIIHDNYMIKEEVQSKILSSTKYTNDKDIALKIEILNDTHARVTINTKEYIIAFKDSFSFNFKYHNYSETIKVSGDKIEITNNKTKNIKTVDKYQNILLPHTTFTVIDGFNITKPNIEYKKTTNLMEYNAKVDKDGKLNLMLPLTDNNGIPIIYRIEETKSPDGYSKIEEPAFIYFSIDDRGFVSVHNLNEFTNLNDIKTTTAASSPNDDVFNFDYDAFYTKSFVQKGKYAYNMDVNKSYDEAIKDIKTDDFNLEVFLPINNRIARASYKVQKDIKTDDVTAQKDLETFLKNNAPNGYKIISEDEYQSFVDVPDEDIVNEETDKIYVEELPSDVPQNEKKIFKRGEYVVNSSSEGVYPALVTEDTKIKINNKNVKLTSTEYNDLTLKDGDKVSILSGYLILQVPVKQEVEELPESEKEYEQGAFINTISGPTEFSINEADSKPYYIQTDNATVEINGIQSKLSNDTYLVTPKAGNIYRVTDGDINVYEAHNTVKLPDKSNKVYTDDLANHKEVTAVENKGLVGANIEFRLWNDELDSRYSYDHTLLTTTDGRAIFKEIPIYDKKGNSIIYHLQEVGTPEPINPDPVVTNVSFGIDAEGNIFTKQADVINYSADGETVNVDVTKDKTDDAGLNAVKDNSNLQTDTNRIDNVKDITATKTSSDASGDNKFQAGENVTYTIGIKNVGTDDRTITIKDDVKSQLGEFFILDDTALSQVLDMEEIDIRKEAKINKVDITNADGEITISNYDAGDYQVVINSPSIISINGEEKAIDDFNQTITLNEGDVFTVLSGSVTLKRVDAADNEKEYTLNDLINGFEYTLRAKTQLNIKFTLKAKDNLSATNGICKNVTNTAEIDIDTGTDTDILKPTVTNPIECDEIPFLEETGTKTALFILAVVVIGGVSFILVITKDKNAKAKKKDKPSFKNKQ